MWEAFIWDQAFISNISVFFPELVYTYWLQWQAWTFLFNIIMIISEYHAYKTIWTLFINNLNSLSTASNYQEWFRLMTRASKWD